MARGKAGHRGLPGHPPGVTSALWMRRRRADHLPDRADGSSRGVVRSLPSPCPLAYKARGWPWPPRRLDEDRAGAGWECASQSSSWDVWCCCRELHRQPGPANREDGPTRRAVPPSPGIRRRCSPSGPTRARSSWRAAISAPTRRATTSRSPRPWPTSSIPPSRGGARRGGCTTVGATTQPREIGLLCCFRG
jgi:hypothetical protein